MKHLFFVLCVLSCTAYADALGTKLDTFFNSMGFSSNVTSAAAYHSQAAGYYTSGSVFARTPVKTLHPMTIQLPHTRAGCSGIDIFSGGISFVNADELVNAGRAIINNAAGYAFHLGLETLCPVCANGFKYFESLANTVNQANINSCETAEALVGGLWPKTQAANKLICEDLAQNDSAVAGWSKARQACGNGGKVNAFLDAAKNKDSYKGLVLHNTNIAWEALKKNAVFSDAHIKALLMSLSGTIVVRTKSANGKAGDDQDNEIQFFPALADSPALFKGLLDGGTDVTLYVCDETTDCLYPAEKKEHIAASESLTGKVRKLLNGMLKKVHEDTELTQEEIQFLNAVHFPLYKMLNVQVAFSSAHTPLNVTQYAQFIATEILFSYLNTSLSQVMQGASQLQHAQVEAFRQGVRHTMARLNAKRRNAYQSVVLAQRMTQEVMQLEQVLSSQLSARIANSLGWAEGLF